MDSLPAKMALGAMGGTGAAVFCHPFDVIRVSMQVSTVQRSTLTTALEVFKESGLRRGLYSGLSAAFLRQWTYGAARIGIYSFLLTGRGLKPSEITFAQKLSFGVISGGIGSVMGTPAELALVRMGADAKLPASERRGLGVHRVLMAVIQEKGVLGMWSGVGPTVARACALSSTSLGVTSECKQKLPKLLPSIKEYPTINMVLSTTFASFCATVASQPFDVVKSRIQNMKIPASGVPPYTGSVDCAMKTVAEGPLAFFRGFSPAFIKLAPFTVLSLNIVEVLTKYLTGKSAL